MSDCPQCEGSVNDANGYCMDCGFDTMQYVNEFEAWLDTLPPVEEYQEAA